MKEELRNRIYNMETAPPKGVWNRITADLDQSDIGASYASRLAGLSVMPPATAWEKIESELHPASAPVRRAIPWLKYAAAAVILAALAWGGVMVLSGNKSGDEIVKTGETPVIKQPTPEKVKVNDPPPVTEEVAIREEEARNDAALEASKKTYAKLNTPKRNKITNAAGFHFSLDVPEPVISPDDMDPATRYIVLMTPDGNIIRMSKKWSDLLCCVAGEEEDAGCTDQLKKWREKLAHSSQTASPGNFGDIMELVKSLQND
jgi:hypothetical protein